MNFVELEDVDGDKVSILVNAILAVTEVDEYNRCCIYINGNKFSFPTEDYEKIMEKIING